MDRTDRMHYLAIAFLLAVAVLGLRMELAGATAPSASGGEGAYPGNTLISVMTFGYDGRLVEVTPDGDVVWEFDPPNSRVFDAERLDDGDVLVAVATRRRGEACPERFRPGPDGTCVENRVVELDYPSTTVAWEYSWFDEKVHNHEVHDADRLPDGRTAIVDMGNDRAFVVDRSKEVVWEWRAENHLAAGTDFYERYGGHPDPSTADWTHMNDVDRLENGNFQLSIRNFDVVVEVDPETKAVVDVVGRPGDHSLLYEQHNPNRLEDSGTVLVADSENDRVVELDVETGAVVWEYGGTGTLNWPRDADRLPNGNTLVVDTFNRRVVEVDPDGEVVWEYRDLDVPYSADRVGVGEEPDGVPGGRTLRSRTTDGGVAAGLPAQVEAWASAVFPDWVRLPELATLLVAVVLGLGLAADAAALAWRGRT